MTPRGERVTPKSEKMTPKSERMTPKGERPTPKGERTTPKGERWTPKSEKWTPKGAMISSETWETSMYKFRCINRMIDTAYHSISPRIISFIGQKNST